MKRSTRFLDQDESGLADTLEGAAMLLGCTPGEAADALLCAIRHYDDDAAALTVLTELDLAWSALGPNHLRKAREIMTDNDKTANSYARARDPKETETSELLDRLQQLEAANEMLRKQNMRLANVQHFHAPTSASTAAASYLTGFQVNEDEEEGEPGSFAGDLLREIGSRAARGAKQELSAQAKKAIIAGVRQFAPNIPQGPAYDAGLAIVVPLILLAVGRVAEEYADLDVDSFAGKLLAGVTEGAGLAMESTSKETVRAVISGAAPALLQLAAITRPELAAGGFNDE